MVTMNEVVAQFRDLKIKPSFWCRAEIRELPNILVPGERIAHLVTGWYEGGFALLCCTDQRVLLIDKKPFFLNIEDLHYDKIAEVKYQYSLLDASLRLTYAGRMLNFKSWNPGKLRGLVTFVQESILEMRNLQMGNDTWMYRTPAFNTTQNSGYISATTDPQPAAEPRQAEVTAEIPHRHHTYSIHLPHLPKNPYSTGRPLARRKLSRFVTFQQLAQ